MNELVEKAMKAFKKEQEERKIESIKNSFKKVVNRLCEIKNANSHIDKIFEELGFTLSDEFRAFLNTVDHYDDLIFVNINGNIGIGTNHPNSDLHIINFETKEIIKESYNKTLNLT